MEQLQKLLCNDRVGFNMALQSSLQRFKSEGILNGETRYQAVLLYEPLSGQGLFSFCLGGADATLDIHSQRGENLPTFGT